MLEPTQVLPLVLGCCVAELLVRGIGLLARPYEGDHPLADLWLGPVPSNRGKGDFA